jgi:hypothetical protein
MLDISSFALSAIFVIRLAMRNFWSRPPGRAIMLLAAGACITTGLSSYRLLVGPAPEWLGYTVFALIPLSFLYLNVTLTQSRRRADRRTREKENQP